MNPSRLTSAFKAEPGKELVRLRRICDLDRQQEKMTSTCDLILTALHVYDYLGWMAFNRHRSSKTR